MYKRTNLISVLQAENWLARKRISSPLPDGRLINARKVNTATDHKRLPMVGLESSLRLSQNWGFSQNFVYPGSGCVCSSRCQKTGCFFSHQIMLYPHL